MRAIHILSTLPSGENYRPAFYEVAAMLLSALLWKEFNGSICLYTDRKGYQCIDRLGLSREWDDINLQVLEALPDDIDWSTFWAGAKIFALKNESSPVAMIDTDLFVWQDIRTLCFKHKLVTLHRESLIDCYLPKNKLIVGEGYVYPDGLDWSILPCNTAFAYFADNSFKDLYVQEAIRFMRGNTNKSNDGNARMVFAEQRLLAMLAYREGINIGTLIDDPYSADNYLFTHLWGAKIIARKEPVQRASLEDAILKKIRLLSKPAYDRLSRMKDSLTQ